MVLLNKVYTKTNTSPWIFNFNTNTITNYIPDPRDNTKQIYTPDEVANTLTPYINLMISLPGLQKYLSRSYIDDNTLRVTRQFDTTENAQNFITTTQYSNNSFILNYRNLITQKLSDNNVTYTDIHYEIVDANGNNTIITI